MDKLENPVQIDEAYSKKSVVYTGIPPTVILISYEFKMQNRTV